MAKAPKGPKVRESKVNFDTEPEKQVEGKQTKETFRPKIGQLRQKEFGTILSKQKKKFKEEGDSYIFGETMVNYFDRVRKGYNYTDESMQKENIRKPVRDYIFDYGLALDGLRDLGFDEMNDFQKVTSQFLQNLPKAGLTEKESTVVTNLVGNVNERLKDLLGVTTRLKFGVKDFLKQFTPLKLLQRYAPGPVADFAARIEQRKEQAERQQQRTRRAIIKGGRKTGGGISTVEQDFFGGPEEGTGARREELAKKGAFEQVFTGGPIMPSIDRETMVEEERESDKQYGETKSILEKLLEAQLETNELLGGKKDSGIIDTAKNVVSEYGDDALKIGGTGVAFAFRKRLAGFVGNILKTAGLGKFGGDFLTKYSTKGTGGQNLKGGETDTKETKKTPKTNKANRISKATKVIKTGAKGFLGKVPWLAPIIAGYDLVSGATVDAKEILDVAPDEEVGFLERLAAGVSKAAESFTFGALDATKTAKFLTGRRTEAEKIQDMQNIPSASTFSEDGSDIMTNIPSTAKADEIIATNLDKDVATGVNTINNNLTNSNNVVNNIDNSSTKNVSSDVPLSPINNDPIITNTY